MRIRLGRYAMEVHVSKLSDSVNYLTAAVGRAEVKFATLSAVDPDVAALTAQVASLQTELSTMQITEDNMADTIASAAQRLDALGAVPDEG